MAKLVIVSNRVILPRERSARAGGLALGVGYAIRRYGGLWFGWSGEVDQETSSKPQIVSSGKITYATIHLGPIDHGQYYSGFANSTLWPLFHYRLGILEFRRDDFAGYLRVNHIFAAALAPLVQSDDPIWVHDYHLIPLGDELRQLGLNNRIGFFFHTPFSAASVLELLPCHEQLVQALCAYDLIGFQTDQDLRAFEYYIEHKAGGMLLGDGAFTAFGRRSRAEVFGIGIDTTRFARMAAATAGSPETKRLQESLAGRQLIIGVDRLDHSKGLPNRFTAYERLFAGWPEHRTKVTLLQIASRSRTDIAQYRALGQQLEQTAGRINGTYADFDWAPIRYLNKTLSQKTLSGFYRVSQVGLVTPLRDGMNLVAKEYVAAQDAEDPGVLILSRFAGSARELDTALIVNPLDIDQITEALHQALLMPIDERRARWEPMMAAIRRRTVRTWCESFISSLRGTSGPRGMDDPKARAR